MKFQENNPFLPFFGDFATQKKFDFVNIERFKEKPFKRFTSLFVKQIDLASFFKKHTNCVCLSCLLPSFPRRCLILAQIQVSSIIIWLGKYQFWSIQ